MMFKLSTNPAMQPPSLNCQASEAQPATLVSQSSHAMTSRRWVRRCHTEGWSDFCVPKWLSKVAIWVFSTLTRCSMYGIPDIWVIVGVNMLRTIPRSSWAESSLDDLVTGYPPANRDRPQLKRYHPYRPQIE